MIGNPGGEGMIGNQSLICGFCGNIIQSAGGCYCNASQQLRLQNQAQQCPGRSDQSYLSEILSKIYQLETLVQMLSAKLDRRSK